MKQNDVVLSPEEENICKPIGISTKYAAILLARRNILEIQMAQV